MIGRDDRLYAMRHAHEHIMINMNMLSIDVSLREFTISRHKLDNQFQAPRYNGMIRRWDSVTKDLLLPIQNTMSKALFFVVEAGMVVCVLRPWSTQRVAISNQVRRSCVSYRDRP